MLPPIKVLVVDDSALMRRLIARVLETNGQFKVIDTASDGEEGIKKIRALKPDAVTLDVEMPVLDGLATLGRIMKECPVPVVMLSTLTTRGTRTTYQSLALGAVDFVAKPSNPGEMQTMAAELALKLKAAAKVTVGKMTRQPVLRRVSLPVSPPREIKPIGKKIDLVVVGSSTGGPAALQNLIPALPTTFPSAVVLVQHLPVGFSGPLAEHLDRKSRLKVKHAQQGDKVIPGQVLVAPAGYYLTFRGRPGNVTINLDPGQGPVPPGGFRPNVDGVMQSAAEIYRNRVMGVLLTGMGRDGAKGMLAIKQKGGPTIAEAESSCVVFGMPKAAIELGAADKVRPLHEIAEEIVRMV